MFSVAGPEFQVGVLAPEDFWEKIFPGEEFLPVGESSVVRLAFLCHLYNYMSRSEIARDSPTVTIRRISSS